MDKGNDHLTRRCPRLGGPVSFQYCRTCADNEHPCFKVIHCWWEEFDILRYLEANLPREALQELIEARPKPKVCSIIDLIQQARQRSQ